MPSDYRKVFDAIPEQFERYRPRYSPELFRDLITYAGIGPGSSVIEIGPGTGQATAPILETGCDYLAVELGENFTQVMKKKFSGYPNFRIVNDDFVTHDFGDETFDLVYSAASIQWIPEEDAFSKTFALLKPGGKLAMMLTSADYKTPNEELYTKIQKVYDGYFRPEAAYREMKKPFVYSHACDYGYVSFEKREFPGERVFTAEEYVAFSQTHSDHIVIPEPYRTPFFRGLYDAVKEAGDRIVFRDTYVLYLAEKPAHRCTGSKDGTQSV